MLTTTTRQSVSVSSPLCHQSHWIRKCHCLTKKTPDERFHLVKTHKFCINFLDSGHVSAGYPSKYNCLSCQKHHYIYFTLFLKQTLRRKWQPQVSMLVAPAIPCQYYSQRCLSTYHLFKFITKVMYCTYRHGGAMLAISHYNDLTDCFTTSSLFNTSQRVFGHLRLSCVKYHVD